jgi:hypothetical protein
VVVVVVVELAVVVELVGLELEQIYPFLLALAIQSLLALEALVVLMA